MNFKNTLRKEIEYKLNQLENKNKLSNTITKKIISSEAWKSSNSIFLYISFKNEVDTQYIINECIKVNKKVYAPLITPKNMSFFRIDNLPKNSLVKSSYGIYEPPLGLKEEFPNKHSLMLIPGVSFTKDGYRLGRGGGYYDKYLSKHKDQVNMGITFNIQISDKIELEPWDELMDIVITEKDTFIRGVENGNN